MTVSARLIAGHSSAALALAACAPDSSRPLAPKAPAEFAAVAAAATKLRGTEVGGNRLGCLVFHRDPSGIVSQTHIEGPQLRLAPRRGVVHLTEIALSDGVTAECFLTRRDTVSQVASALRRTNLHATAWTPSPATSNSRSVRGGLAKQWFTSKLSGLLGPEAGALTTGGVSLSLSGLPQCPADVIYIVGSCVSRINAVAGDSYVWLDFYDLTFKMSYAPVSLNVYLPLEEQIIRWAICSFTSDMAQELDAAAQAARAESEIESAAFAASGGDAIMCEHVLNVGNRELCVDLYIEERRIGAPFTFGMLSGLGDNRLSDPNAPRKESRVQINLDPETLTLNAFISHSTVEMIGGWTRTFGGDGSLILQNDGPSHDWPASVRRMSLSRLNGDPNTAVLDYDVANNVCGNWSLCPTITGHWVFTRDAAGNWTANTAMSRTDTFPHQSLNRFDAATNQFHSLLEIPEDMKAKLKGLDDFREMDSRIRLEQQKLFNNTGCPAM